MRDVYAAVVGTPPCQTTGGWQLNGDSKRETPTQRALFEALAGQWMGRDRRRGVHKKRDGRIDMPDLYRVGFGLGRKGGVKPKTHD